MLGVFGAGIVTTLQKEDSYQHIDTIYGASAGAFNAAYFLSHQAKMGSTIYWEDLTHNFIDQKGVLKKTTQRILNRLFPRLDVPDENNPLNIDHLIEVIQTNKKLDVEEINEGSIDFYVKVLDTETGEIKFLDAKEDIIQRLRETISALPYYYSKEQRYIDGDILEHLNIEYLLKKYPKEKIVAVINHKSKEKIGLRTKIKTRIEALMAETMYPKNNLKKYYITKENKIKKEIEIASNSPRTLLLLPPEESPTEILTTDPKKLKKTYRLGKKEANKIIKFIKNW